MVGDPGRTPGPRRVRRLKEPRPLTVEAGPDGIPVALITSGGRHAVSLVRRPWRIDQLWWRVNPVSRVYFQVAPEDGPPLTLFHDLVRGGWWRQEY